MTSRLLALCPLVLALGCGGADWVAPPVPDGIAVPPAPGDEKKTKGVEDEDDDKPAPKGEGEDEEAEPKGALGPAELKAKIAQFQPVVIQADLGKLPKKEGQALVKLIEASKLLDPIFDRQVYAKNPELQKKLEADNTELGHLKLTYFKLHRGPWDRQDHHRPFAIDAERPAGAGFYPEGLTKDAFEKYLKANPNDKPKLTDLFTVVQQQGDKLVAVPYSTAYKAWLEPSAKLLREAAELTQNASLKKFLASRAAAFLSDDYYQSDVDWMDLDSQVEITIGPYEVYEDTLMGAKASFESFVTVVDPDASKKLTKYKDLLPDMEAHLPVPAEVKTKRGKESPIRVADLVFAAGDARKSVQTIAFNLPNDEKVREQKGSKKVLLRNVIEKKFEVILKPIASAVLEGGVQKHLSGEAFVNFVLFHELSHGLGPAYVNNDTQKKIDVRVALEANYAPLEECKADVMGAYNLLYMIEKGLFPKTFREQMLTTYVGGLFRSVRFGVAESHGKGAAVQINRYVEAGALVFDEQSARFSIDFAKLEKAIADLTRDLAMVQHKGDKAGAETLLKTYGVASRPMQKALEKAKGVPVDLKPVYPAAGEKG
jgi:hypothetical protein